MKMVSYLVVMAILLARINHSSDAEESEEGEEETGHVPKVNAPKVDAPKVENKPKIVATLHSEGPTDHGKKDETKKKPVKKLEKVQKNVPLSDNIKLADKKVKDLENKLAKAKQRKDDKEIKALADRLRTARITRKQMDKAGQLQTLPSICVSFIIIIIAAYCLY